MDAKAIRERIQMHNGELKKYPVKYAVSNYIAKFYRMIDRCCATQTTEMFNKHGVMCTIITGVRVYSNGFIKLTFDESYSMYSSYKSFRSFWSKLENYWDFINQSESENTHSSYIGHTSVQELSELVKEFNKRGFKCYVDKDDGINKILYLTFSF